MIERKAKLTRETKETSVKVELSLDGTGEYEITTGIRFFDHMLGQLAQHGLFDIKLSATGVDQHHVVEDVAICLGRAFVQALGDKRGIVRMGYAVVPMDDALALVAVDIGGRSYIEFEASFGGESVSGMSVDLVRHFFVSFASEAKVCVHAKVLSGVDDHHKAEALFKALARAFDMATRFDERLGDKVPSTKDIIDS
jgi:imidazoleglycerol-phosphate dehydratase